jgi:hypothetical protein
VATGGHIEHRDDPVLGSWFRGMRARVSEFVDSPLGHEVKNLAAHAAESRLVHAQDATVTATMLQNLGPVLVALQPTKEAVIRAGALLIVKMDSTLVVHQLTPAQQLQLDHQPQLAQSPYDILSALELRPSSSAQSAEGVDGARGSATELRSLNGKTTPPKITRATTPDTPSPDGSRTKPNKSGYSQRTSNPLDEQRLGTGTQKPQAASSRLEILAQHRHPPRRPARALLPRHHPWP